MTETGVQGRERVLAVVICPVHATRAQVEERLAEIEQLAQLAGADVVSVYSLRTDPQGVPLVRGTGARAALRERIGQERCHAVVWSQSLSPREALRWESVLKRRVVDLPELILDGLARHSASAETHILVEMAQLLLLRGRLPRKGPLFSRMGEGVGTQAPGHHLEVTRAGLQTRLHQIRREWKKLDETRALQCQSRSSLPRAVLLGFPNSGKTQLFRRLTGEDVPCSHSPYSTLHTLTRRVAIPAIDPFLVTDTLSFIPGLFAEGLSAFRPTLRWIQSAEVLVLVLDAGSAWVEEHLTEMNEFLKQIGCAEKARVTVFNQMDRVEHPGNLRELARDIQPHVCISARLDREFAGLGAMIHQSYREAMQSLAAGGEEEWP